MTTPPPDLPPAAPDPEPERLRPVTLPSWLPWTAAAVFAGIAAWLGQIYLAERAENLRQRDLTALTTFELRTARNQLEAGALLTRHELADVQKQLADRDEKIAALTTQLKEAPSLTHLEIIHLAPPAGASSEAFAVVVWDPLHQVGVLQAGKLPALAADHDYQLWIGDPQHPDPVASGAFRVDPATGEARVTFHPDEPVKRIARFVVSRERQGGVSQPEGPIVLLGE